MTVQSRTEEAIFEQARERTNPHERAALVEQACAGDASLKRRVLELLAAHDASQGPLDVPPPGLGATQASSVERPGTQIGPYKLLQQIGEGGMGVVYMAEQEQPVRRRVALKIIKPGMDTRQVIARFEAERQALSLMDHPNIAKVLDAGTTGPEKGDGSLLPERPAGCFAQKTPDPFFSAGRPYFVMELVRGTPITQYCDEHHLTPRQRLELLVPVCQAIQHAHQKGIIHRDIKPTNILVAEYDEKPVPKVIDFGVAKAIGSPLTEKTMFTGFGQLVGTLEYMSPEQAKVNQLDIDTRSDIYSLGVLMYELLTGSTPFDKHHLRSAAWDEMLRIIREEEPEKPSTRLSSRHTPRAVDSSPHAPHSSPHAPREEPGHVSRSETATLASIAAVRGTEPAKLTKLLRGELDWIVMKALEKDRSRRYETASSFAADLQHYLNDEPVVACPPSVGYRLRKFVRRNKFILTALSAVAAALVLGTLVSVWQAVRATNAETLAQAQRQSAIANLQAALEAVDQMLTRVGDEVLLDVPRMEPVRRALLEDALRFYERFFRANTNDPAIALETAQAHRRVGVIYRHIGRYPESEKAYQQALDLLANLKVEAPAAAQVREARAMTHKDLAYLLASGSGNARDEDAIKAYRQAISIWRELATESPQHADYRLELADCLQRLSIKLRSEHQSEQAEKFLQEALALEKDLVATAADNLLYQHRLAIGYHFLGQLRNSDDRLNEATAAWRKCVEIQENLVAKAPERFECRHLSAEANLALAKVLVRQKQNADAVTFFRRAIDHWKRLTRDFPGVPDCFQHLAHAYTNLGNVLKDTGHRQEAEAVFRDAIALRDKVPRDFPDLRLRRIAASLANSYRGLAIILAESGREAEAVQSLRQGIDQWQEWPGEPAPELAWMHHQLAALLLNHGGHAEAAEACDQAIAVFEKLHRELEDKPAAQPALDNLRRRLRGLLLGCFTRAQALQKMQQLQAAESAFREGIALLSKFGKTAPDLPATTLTRELSWCYRGLGETLAEGQRHHEAVDALRQAAELREQLPNELGYRMWLANDYYKLSRSFEQLGRLEDALQSGRERLVTWEKIAADFPQAVEHRKGRGWSHAQLGFWLCKMDRIEEAGAHYRNALELFEKLTVDFPDDPECRRGVEEMRKNLGGLPNAKQPPLESTSN